MISRPRLTTCIVPIAVSALVASTGPAVAVTSRAQTIHHIEILTQLQSLPAEYWHSSYASPDNPLIQQLLPLDATKTASLTAALDRLPPVLRGSISKLSIADYQGDGVAGDTWGNNIIVSSAILSDPQQLADTIAHEATHCFHRLMEPDGETDTSNLPPDVMPAVEEARKAIGNSSVSHILARLQSTAMVVDEGYPDYARAAWETRYDNVSTAVADGFVSPYAAEEPREDLAEMVAMLFADDFADHAYCSQFEGLDGRVERQQALAFAKLNFVRALGLIDEGRYRQCVRDADPVDAEVIQMGSLEFGDPRHGTQIVRHEDLENDWLMWRIRGEAPYSRLEIRLRIRRVQDAPIGSAIGFYELDKAGSYGFAADRLIPVTAQNVILYQRTDTSNDDEFAASARISGGGYALITVFDDDRVKGYAFDVPLHSIIGLDTEPTETVDIIWFLWER